MQDFLNELPKLAREKYPESKKFFARLKKRTPKRLDLMMQELHEETFEETDCLTCGNCCKTASPIITEKDMNRISKSLKMKEVHFMEQYIERDSDDYYVFKSTPCPFLDLNDNSCFIYEDRPKACREYPHTNRRRFIQLTDLTLKNTEICPAAYKIVEGLKKKLPQGK